MAVDTATKGGVGSGESESGGQLHKELTSRHITMIALGGAIGVGLFMLSGRAIHAAGPSLLLTYAFAGLVVLMVVRGLGELSVHRPVTGSLASHASEFIGPWAGFFTGWTYWLTWVIAAMAEITAVSMYVGHWAPNFPEWITSGLVLIVFLCCNMVSVKIFAESEFWFSLVKILALVGIIAVGVVVILFGVGHLGETASFTHLWSHSDGGFFPHGAMAPILALQFAIVAFYGIELVGVAAGEVENPEKVLPKAINSIGRRIMFCYLGSLAVILSLVVWSEFMPGKSPFILVFSQLGIPFAAALVNFVVITAAFSAGNTTLFCTGRMLYALSQAGHAPKRFARLSRNGIPIRAILASAGVMVFAVALKYLDPEGAFNYITSFSSFIDLTVWFMITMAHLGYLKAVRKGGLQRGKFKMPFAPYSNYIIMVVLVGICCTMAFRHEGRLALLIAPFWVAFLYGGYTLMLRRRRKQEALMIVDPLAETAVISASATSEHEHELVNQ